MLRTSSCLVGLLIIVVGRSIVSSASSKSKPRPSHSQDEKPVDSSKSSLSHSQDEKPVDSPKSRPRHSQGEKPVDSSKSRPSYSQDEKPIDYDDSDKFWANEDTTTTTPPPPPTKANHLVYPHPFRVMDGYDKLTSTRQGRTMNNLVDRGGGQVCLNLAPPPQIYFFMHNLTCRPKLGLKDYHAQCGEQIV